MATKQTTCSIITLANNPESTVTCWGVTMQQVAAAIRAARTISEQIDTDKPGVCTAPIPVDGHHGFGVVMPVDVDRDCDPFTNYTDKRDAYVAVRTGK